jgi:outer membrane protein assembly factor BamB
MSTGPASNTPESPIDPSRVRRFPVKLTVVTLVAVMAGVLAVVFISDIEDVAHLGLDVVMVITLLTIIGLILLWLGWILFLSRWKWVTRIIASIVLLLVPYGLLKVFRPVHGGDTNPMRFEPIWVQRPELSTAEVVENTGVDLNAEAPSDFARFLGHDQDGVIRNGSPIDAAAFTQKARIVWKNPIGLGWSGFSARNGYAVTMEQRGDDECVTCYEIATGSLKWIYSYKARHKDSISLGRVGPRSTPTIHQGHVYAIGALGHLVCLNGADGSVVWKKELNEVLGITLGEAEDSDGFKTYFENNTTLSWGRSGAPLIVDDTVVIPGGGPAGEQRATLLAFDLMTGEEKWRSGTEMIAYGSPVLATVAGRRQILMTAETLALGFDASTGEQLWSHPRPGQTDGAANTSQLTVISESDVLTSKGYPDGGGERIHLEDKDGTLVATSVWQTSQVLKTKLTSPLLHDGYAYSLSNAFMECARLSDGKQMWKRRGRFGHGQVLLVGDKILVHSEWGQLFLLEATPDEYRELGKVETIDGICWNTLCLTGNLLLVRSELEAACIEIPTVDGESL